MAHLLMNCLRWLTSLKASLLEVKGGFKVQHLSKLEITPYLTQRKNSPFENNQNQSSNEIAPRAGYWGAFQTGGDKRVGVVALVDSADSEGLMYASTEITSARTDTPTAIEAARAECSAASV